MRTGNLTKVAGGQHSKRYGLAVLIGVLAFVLASCSSSSSSTTAASKTSANPYHLTRRGVLTVGMDLQFKPEMYLNSAGQPAGYDPILLRKLAATMHLKLKIENLGFNGLIPGLEAGKFDMVSVGLAPTPAREKAVSFTRAYVPYELILAAPSNSALPATIAAWNSPSVTLTALEGSTDAQLAAKVFPKAHLETFTSDTAALLQVATHRADGIVIENYLLAEFNHSNPGELKIEPFKKPLQLQYGSWAVQKGNTSFVSYLNSWLCKQQQSGFLAQAYKQAIGTTLPPMPPC